MKTINSRQEVVSNPDPSLYNPDLAPVPNERKNWTWWTYSTFWMAIAHNLVAWTLAGQLIAKGMSFWQAMGVLATAYGLIYVFILLNSISGAKYGLPFPVIIRSAFGHRGALVPIIVRVILAVFWFGVYLYLGGEAINVGLNVIPWWASLGNYSLIGMGLNQLISYVICVLIHLYLVTHGIERIKRFELWAGPLVMIFALGLLIWAVKIDGFGSLISRPSTLSGGDFWAVFFIGVTGLLGTCTTLITNIPDLSRFARSQKDQIIGQTIGVPGMYLLYSGVSLLVTAGTISAFGKAIADPLQLLLQFNSPWTVIPAVIIVFAAVIAGNISTNAVSVGFDLTSLFPKHLSFSKSGVVAVIIGILSVPWLWYHGSTLIDTIMSALGAIMGPILAVMLVDFYLIRRRKYDLTSFFVKNGAYTHRNGVGVRALISLAFGVVLALIGLAIPALSVLYHYSWFLGVGGSALCYIFLMKVKPPYKEFSRVRERV